MKRIVSLAVSLGILVAIYLQIDVPRLLAVFRECHGGWMAVSLAMVIPITMLTALRLQALMPPGSALGFGEANRLILAASVLNMVLPAKMGDIAKAAFMKDRGHLGGTLALSLVVFEKTCDMLSLLCFCAFGLFLYPAKDGFFWLMTAVIGASVVAGAALIGSTAFTSLFFGLARAGLPGKLKAKVAKLESSWREMHGYFWERRARLLLVAAMSLVLWFLHMLQIWLFILALRAWAPFVINLALSPLAILAGLLPLTFAGVGTRDAALILLYRPYFDAAAGAALGLLCTARYLLPAIGGLPFLQQYLQALQRRKNESPSAPESATLAP